MKNPEERLWDEITESAKGRFNYDAFKKAFVDFENDSIPDHILFQIILGYVAHESNEEIATKINRELALRGVLFENAELGKFLENKEVELKAEIRATDIAIAPLNRGAQMPGILMQVRSILDRWPQSRRDA